MPTKFHIIKTRMLKIYSVNDRKTDFQIAPGNGDIMKM
jgi:hypothetical protein